MSKYGIFSGPYFPAFGLNTERYSVSLRIQSEYGKIRTRKNSVFGHFPHSACFGHKIEFSFNYKNLLLLKKQNQYAQKINRVKFFYNTQIFLHSFEVTRGCTATELKTFFFSPLMYNHTTSSQLYYKYL